MSNYHIKDLDHYHKAYEESVTDPTKFWDEIAGHYEWSKGWSNTNSWDFSMPDVRWFEGGQLNITENCLDRHLADNGDKNAIVWQPNNPEDAPVQITYKELHEQVCQMANLLKKFGCEKGDRVVLYMPMIPELAVAVLACARVGAVHSVVFAGFSAQALADRINDSQAKFVITSDGMYRGAKQIPIKPIIDDALTQCDSIETVLVKKHTGEEIQMHGGRDIWIDQELKSVEIYCPAEPMNSEDLLFILYTSGSTGKPKGVVHTCGGYMVYAGYSFKNVFQYEDNDVYWCTADIGWITGHTYIVYGPLLNAATTVMFEGVPSWPDAGTFWKLCEKLGVNQFYTAPTAIRALMACGDELVNQYDLSELKVIGSVGEPINEEAWEWYHKVVGKGNIPIVDTWWQTETGGIMISGLGNISEMKASHAGLPLPGIQPVLLDPDGNEITENGKEGLLCIKHPWPSMIRTTYGDHERCYKVYFSAYKDHYFTGDGAKRDANGLYRIIGRVDDVINVSGHRFGTAEIEDAINGAATITESAVVGYPHEIKGQGIYAYVVLDNAAGEQSATKSNIISAVEAQIGKIARPDKIQIVSGLPKTRSGKIMRRILRKVAEGNPSNLGDTSTLLDPSVVEEIIGGSLAD